MKAARFYGAGDIRVEDIPEPAVTPDGVKLRIEWCGICGTDLGEYRYGPLGIPTEPHPLTGEVLPVVLGHEISGTVIDVGALVNRFVVGDRVLVNPMLHCGICQHCRQGRFNICESLAVHGLSGGGGGLAEYTVVPEYALHRLPDGLSLDLATLAEPVAVALRAIRRSGVSTRSQVVVFGAGPLGLILISCLRNIGVERITAIEPSEYRKQLAAKVGAVELRAPGESPPNAKFDVAYEASGVGQALDEAIALTRAGGTVMHLARFKRSTLIDPNLLRAEITLMSSQAYIDEISEALDLVANDELPLEHLISHRVPLESVVNDGFEMLVDPGSRSAKVLVRCHTA